MQTGEAGQCQWLPEVYTRESQTEILKRCCTGSEKAEIRYYTSELLEGRQ